MHLQQTLELITKQLEQSKSWTPINRNSIDFARFEGTLPEATFNQQFLEALLPFQDVTTQLDITFACGFEIEFYLEPKYLNPLQHQLAAMLPESQMLLIELDKVVPTNGLNFYLMAENTGKPPEGFNSYEIVSPVLDAKALPYFLEKITKQLHSFAAQDNEHIGFHLHVSTPKCEAVSPLALIYFLDQSKVFNWPSRQFTRDIVPQFFSHTPQAWQCIYEEITRKCYNLNLLRYPDNNRIELRSVGGTGYLDDAKQLIHTCFNTFTAYQHAHSTPSEEVAQKILETYDLSKTVLSTHDHSLEHLQEMQDAIWLSHFSPTAQTGQS